MDIFEIGSFFFVELIHGFDGSLRDVDIGDVLIAVVEHLLAESCIDGEIREFPEPTLRMRNSTGMFAPMRSRIEK